MTYKFEIHNFDTVQNYWEQLLHNSQMKHFFLTIEWQKSWWANMGTSSHDLNLVLIKENDEPIGIAPLMKTGESLTFLGSTDLWDMHDFIIATGKEKQFFEGFCQYINEESWTKIHLESLIAGSPTLEFLIPELQKLQLKPELLQEDQLMGLHLPETWDEYLSLLNKKDRHELRRKLRKLERETDYKVVQITSPNEVQFYMDTFLELMGQSREEKSDFLTEAREVFFKQMAYEIASVNMLRLFFLSVNDIEIAAVFCFDYNGTLYLYNSGHNLEYASLGSSFLLKALCIKIAIEENKHYYDLLRGSEGYKQHLGAKEQILYQLSVTR